MNVHAVEVQDVFRQVFNDPNLVIFPAMAASHVSAWDSFNHLNLILALEERFHLRFASEEIAAMTNVGDLFTTLKHHGIQVEW